jgi:hypothetical protein
MLIVFSICAGFVALTLVVALMGSRALSTFFGVIGGALLGVLITGALGVGVIWLYAWLVPDRTGYGTLWLIPVILLLVVAGGLFGAVLGAGPRTGGGIEGDETEELEF